MKLLLDNNLSHKLKDLLKPFYSEIVHLKDIKFQKSDDFTIWNYARKHEYVIVTKDSDFNDISFVNGYPPFIIWLKIGNCSTLQIGKILSENSEEIIQTIERKKAGVIEIEV